MTIEATTDTSAATRTQKRRQQNDNNDNTLGGGGGGPAPAFAEPGWVVGVQCAGTPKRVGEWGGA